MFFNINISSTKEGLFKSVYFGRFIRALNAFPLRTHFADVRSLRWAIKELQAGKALIIFPEGGRSVTGELDEPQAGVGFLALKAGVRIVPAFIAGANHALPFDSKFIRLKKIKVYFGQAIEPEKIIDQAPNLTETTPD